MVIFRVFIYGRPLARRLEVITDLFFHSAKPALKMSCYRDCLRAVANIIPSDESTALLLLCAKVGAYVNPKTCMWYRWSLPVWLAKESEYEFEGACEL